MELSNHENRVLQSLYRAYTHDEKWSFLLRVCKDRGHQIGLLKSEIDELTYKLEQKEAEPKNVVEKVIEYVFVNKPKPAPINVDFENFLKSISCSEESIKHASDTDLTVLQTELLQAKSLYGNGKKKAFTYYFQLINNRLRELKEIRKRNRPLESYMFDIVKETLSNDDFQALIEEAKKRREANIGN